MDVRRPDAAPHAGLIRFVEDRPGHDLRYAINPDRIRTGLDLRPSVTVEEGLALTVDWYLDNRAWLDALADRAGVGERLGRRAWRFSYSGEPVRWRGNWSGERQRAFTRPPLAEAMST